MATYNANSLKVFKKTMSIGDEISETDYELSGDTDEYLYRSKFLINTIGQELYYYSDTCVRKAGKRSHMPLIDKIADAEYDDEGNLIGDLDLDDFCAYGVLPFGLAAKLFADENQALASFCQQEYERLLRLLMSSLTAESEDIEDVYSNSYYYCAASDKYKENCDGDCYNCEYYKKKSYIPYNTFGRW